MKANEKYFAAIFGKPKSERHWHEQRECPLKSNMSLSACKKELENCLDDYTGDSNLFDFKNTRWKTDWEYKGMLFDLESDSEDPIFTVRPSLKRLHDKHVSWLISQAKSKFDPEEIARLMLKYKKNPKKTEKSPASFRVRTENFAWICKTKPTPRAYLESDPENKVFYDGEKERWTLKLSYGTLRKLNKGKPTLVDFRKAIEIADADLQELKDLGEAWARKQLENPQGFWRRSNR